MRPKVKKQGKCQKKVKVAALPRAFQTSIHEMQNVHQIIVILRKWNRLQQSVQHDSLIH